MTAKTETRLNFAVETFEIVGTAPFVSNKFHFDEQPIRRDADNRFHASMYKSAEGWYGIPAGAFKAAMVRACKYFDIKQMLAKQYFFVMHDGLDDAGFVQLVRFTHGKPERFEAVCGNVHVVRGRWAPGWCVVLRIKYDADQLTLSTVRRLLVRAGTDVGIGAGRQGFSCGTSWGTFELAQEVQAQATA